MPRRNATYTIWSNGQAALLATMENVALNKVYVVHTIEL